MYNYCTLFDHLFLTRGLALYESLARYSHSFHLYVLAFDENAFTVLTQLKLPNMTVISMDEFETGELKALKQSRARNEYCWTCTPSLIRYCFETYSLDSCTYLDADLYFFSDPSELIQEMNDDHSVLITEHRYTPQYDQTNTSGIYCVQFMFFNKSKESQNILCTWQEQCNAWCFARCEDGKFGDQKYLDVWPQKYKNIHILKHLGGGVAPWNIQQYKISKQGEAIMGCSFENNERFNVVFYHFHGLRFHRFDKIALGDYDLDSEAIHLIYFPYIKHLDAIYHKYKNEVDLAAHECFDKESWFEMILRKAKIKQEKKNVFLKSSIL